MKRLSFFFVVLTFLAMTVGLASAATFKGSISDKMCGASHNGHDAVTCTKMCVKNGSPYVFVESASKVLEIENQKDTKIASELDKFAGQTVSVTGTASKDGKSIKIESIKAAK